MIILSLIYWLLALLKIRSLYKFYVEFCYKLHMSSWRSRWTKLCSCIYEQVLKKWSVLGIYLYLYY